MSDVVTPAPAPAEAPTWKTRLGKWSSVIVGICALLVGGIKLLDAFTLPACDSSRSLDAVRSIFKDKKLPEPTLNGAKPVTDTSQEKTCTVSYVLPDEKGMLDYRVYWEGWSAQVMISKVHP